MQGDGSQGGKGRRFEVNALRQQRQQVARHDAVVGVHGVAAARAGGTLPGLETLHPLAQCDDRPGRGVTQRHGLVEPVEGRFQRRQQPFAAGLVDHLAHQVRAGAGFPQQGFTGEFDHHALRAGRDERSRRADQGRAGLWAGDGHLGDQSLAGAQILQELLHCGFMAFIVS
jgi:hypothetical protein